MIRDAMDILSPHSEETAQATYYPTRRDPAGNGGKKISYSFIDPRSAAYRRTFGNMQDFDAETTAIKTKDRLDYIVGATIVLSDGTCYKIIERGIDPKSAPKQAFRMFRVPHGVDFILRLQSVDNPWGLS